MEGKKYLDHLAESAEKLREKGRDQSIDVVVANIVNLFPSIGNKIATPILTFLSEVRFREIENFLKAVCEQLAAFEEYIGKKQEVYLASENYMYFVLIAANKYITERAEEKKEAYKTLLVNSVLTAGENIDREEDFLNILSEMSRLEFLILKWFYSGRFQDWEGKEPERKGKLERDIRIETVNGVRFNIRDFDVAITRLDNKGFFKHEGFGADGFLRRLEIFQGLLNEMGKRFLGYLLDYQKTD